MCYTNYCEKETIAWIRECTQWHLSAAVVTAIAVSLEASRSISAAMQCSTWAFTLPIVTTTMIILPIVLLCSHSKKVLNPIIVYTDTCNRQHLMMPMVVTNDSN